MDPASCARHAEVSMDTLRMDTSGQPLCRSIPFCSTITQTLRLVYWVVILAPLMHHASLQELAILSQCFRPCALVINRTFQSWYLEVREPSHRCICLLNCTFSQCSKPLTIGFNTDPVHRHLSHRSCFHIPFQSLNVSSSFIALISSSVYTLDKSRDYSDHNGPAIHGNNLTVEGFSTNNTIFSAPIALLNPLTYFSHDLLCPDINACLNTLTISQQNGLLFYV